MISCICAFFSYSPIEKWQGPLEKNELSGQYQGFRYELLEGDKKGPKAGAFIPLSQLIAHFVRYIHYTMIYLIKKQSNQQVLASLLK